MHNPIINSLRRRLERAELDHLRQICAEQAARIERLESDLSDARFQAECENLRADMWHDMFHDMAEQTGASVGITPAGQVGLVATHAAH